MDQRFRKEERLKSTKLIARIFAEGKSFKGFPIIAVIAPSEEKSALLQLGFSVPRKRLKKAVDRNLVKRRMREAYRLNRNLLGAHELKGFGMMLIYIKNDVAAFPEIEKGIRKILTRLVAMNLEGGYN